jgi:hypothetical protein
MPEVEHFRISFALPNAAARLDALAAAREQKVLESEAPLFLRKGTYPEPFALRALGIVREDDSLIEQAAARFDAMTLTWHAEQTRAMLA